MNLHHVGDDVTDFEAQTKNYFKSLTESQFPNVGASSGGGGGKSKASSNNGTSRGYGAVDSGYIGSSSRVRREDTPELESHGAVRVDGSIRELFRGKVMVFLCL